MVQSAPEQQFEFQTFVVADEVAHDEDDDGIEQPQQQLDFGETAKLLGKVFRVLRDAAAVEVGDAEVEQYIK